MNDYDYKKMGALIRKMRKNKKMSQEVLSGLANIGRSHLAMIETGTKNANVETLWHIAIAMNMTLSQLFKIYEEDL